MSRPFPRRSIAILLVPFILAELVAQDPPAGGDQRAAIPKDLEQLAARVDAAHHPKGPRPPVTSFRGSLLIRSNQEEQRGQAELDVRFLLWHRTADRVRPLIRYRVGDSAQHIERGLDRNGPWAIVDGAARDLDSKELATDRAALNSHLTLARQLLRFLDPGAVLRSLQKPEAIVTAPLRFGREPEQIDCLVAHGELPGFPVASRGGEDTAVRAAIYVEAATGIVVAVHVTPLDQEPGPGKPVPPAPANPAGPKPAAAGGEFLRLLEPQLRDEILVPRKLMQYQTD